jgi:hypothetical protein
VISQVAWLALLLFTPCSKGGDQRDTLSTVLLKHRAARDSIRTLSAKIAIKKAFPKAETVMGGKYWRAFDTVRVQEGITDSAVEDYLMKDSEIHQVGRYRMPNGRPRRYAAARKPASEILSLCDVWTQMLLDFIGTTGVRYDFDRYLGLSKSTPGLSYEKIDSHDCIRLSMNQDSPTGDNLSDTFWLDKDYNYLIRKWTAANSKRSELMESEILEFAEPVPGVFFPTRCRIRRYVGSQLKSEQLATLSDLRVNADLPKDVFALPAVPSGTIVQDHIEGKRYPIDANWRRIGTATPLEPPIRIPDPSSGTYGAQTEREQQSVLVWMVPTSIVVLAAAGVYWFLRRRQPR